MNTDKKINNDEILNKINYCEKAVKASESLRQKAIGQKDVYEAQLSSLDEELVEIGTSSKDAEKDIENIDKQIELILEKVETLIPFELLKKYKLI